MKVLISSCFGFFFCIFVLNAEPYKVILATGLHGGIYYKIGESICNQLNKDPRFQCETVSTDGSLENINKLYQNGAQIVLAQTDTIYSAYNATTQFYARPKFKELRKILLLYPETLNVVVKNDSSISTLSDLKKRDIEIIGQSSGSLFFSKIYLDMVKWSTADRENIDFSSSYVSSYNKLCSGQISAVISVTGHMNANIKDAFTKCNLKFLPVSTVPLEIDLDVLVNTNPFYFKSTIPSNLYNSSQKPVETVAVYSTLTSSTRVPNQVIYDFLYVFFRSLEEIRADNPGAEFSIVCNMKLNEGKDNVPYHQGVLNYFKINKCIQ